MLLAILTGCGEEDSSATDNETQEQETETIVADPDAFPEPLPVEDLGVVLRLPANYPDTYVFINDWSTQGITLVDLTEESYPIVGAIGLSPNPAFIAARTALIGAATHFSRTFHGSRTDVITFFNRETLMPESEIVLPAGKRALFGAVRGLLALIDDEQILLVFNFTPAQSISVVSLDARKVLSEIPIPGCSLVYPMAGRSFATLCGNGTIASYSLAEDGSVASESISDEFNDIANDAMFVQSARIGNIEYYPTFEGNLRPIDMSGRVARPLEPWPLVSEEEYDAGWRPAGSKLATGRPDGRLYILMLEDGSDGSHEEPGTEAWVFDIRTRQRLTRIPLETPGKYIHATQGENGLLAVGNEDDEIDVYDLDGNHLRTLSVSDGPSIEWIYPVRTN